MQFTIDYDTFAAALFEAKNALRTIKRYLAEREAAARENGWTNNAESFQGDLESVKEAAALLTDIDYNN